MQFVLYFKSINEIKKFNPDNLVCYSPSIFFYYFIKNIINKKKIKSSLILRDIFPYWAIECGYLKNNILIKFYINSFISFLKLFDKIGVESKSNILYLRRKTNLKNIYHLPNWIVAQNIKKKNRKIKNSYIFSGNLGGGQDIFKVYYFFNEIQKINKKNNFCILGSGMGHLNTNLFSELKINYYKKLSSKKYMQFLDKYEYGIISLKDEIKSVNFPGRLMAYLNIGLPIILLSEKKNELSNFIISKKIGVTVSSKENIETKLKQLKKIKREFIDFKTNIKVLNKYFNIKINAKKILG